MPYPACCPRSLGFSLLSARCLQLPYPRISFAFRPSAARLRPSASPCAGRPLLPLPLQHFARCPPFVFPCILAAFRLLFAPSCSSLRAGSPFTRRTSFRALSRPHVLPGAHFRPPRSRLRCTAFPFRHVAGRIRVSVTMALIFRRCAWAGRTVQTMGATSERNDC